MAKTKAQTYQTSYSWLGTFVQFCLGKTNLTKEFEAIKNRFFTIIICCFVMISHCKMMCSFHIHVQSSISFIKKIDFENIMIHACLKIFIVWRACKEKISAVAYVVIRSDDTKKPEIERLTGSC